MRDLKVTIVEDVGLDIDIVDGQAVLVDEANQTNDQRASIAVYAMKGTVPGQSDFGMSWQDTYDRETTGMQLSNEAQLQVQNYAGNAGSEGVSLNSQYSTVLISSGKQTGVIIMRG